MSLARNGSVWKKQPAWRGGWALPVCLLALLSLVFAQSEPPALAAYAVPAAITANLGGQQPSTPKQAIQLHQCGQSGECSLHCAPLNEPVKSFCHRGGPRPVSEALQNDWHAGPLRRPPKTADID